MVSKALIFYIFATCCFFTELLRCPTLNSRKLASKSIEVRISSFAIPSSFELEDETQISEEDDDAEDEGEGFRPVPTSPSVSRMFAQLILSSVPKQFHLNERPLNLPQPLYKPSFVAAPILSPMVSSQGPPV